MKIFKIENLHKLLVYIKEKIKLINISAEDLYDGNEKLVFGLLWSLILNFSLQDEKDERLKNTVYKWAKEITSQYDCIDKNEFAKNLSNGRVYNVLLNYFTDSMNNMSFLTSGNIFENFKNAFEVAEQHGIATLIDLNELQKNKELDEKSLFTYLLEFYTVFRNKKGKVKMNNDVEELLIALNHKVKLENEVCTLNEEYNKFTEKYNEELKIVIETLNSLVERILSMGNLVSQCQKTKEKVQVCNETLQYFLKSTNLKEKVKEGKAVSLIFTQIEDKITGVIQQFNQKIADSENKKCSIRVINNNSNEKISGDVSLSINNKISATSGFKKQKCHKNMSALNQNPIEIKSLSSIDLPFLPEMMTLEEIIDHINE